MAIYTTLEALVQTWPPQFVSFLDEEQWEMYNGSTYMADTTMMWKMRGTRRRAWYTLEMVCVKLGHSKWTKVNPESEEDRHQIRCSNCTHSTTTEEVVKTTYVDRLLYFYLYIIFWLVLWHLVFYIPFFLIYLYIAFCLVYLYIL
jgi:hypothetical protein